MVNIISHNTQLKVAHSAGHYGLSQSAGQEGSQQATNRTLTQQDANQAISQQQQQANQALPQARRLLTASMSGYIQSSTQIPWTHMHPSSGFL